MHDTLGAQALPNPLPSAQWHRVAHVRPRLAEHVRITRQRVRGQRWYVLQDERQGHSCRLNASAYEVAARLDGSLSLQALWSLLDSKAQRPSGTQTDAADEPPSQDELMGVVQQLHRHRLLSFDEAPDFGALAAPIDGTRPRTPPQGDANAPASQEDTSERPRNSLMAWRLPLIDPDAWLQRAEPWAQALFSRTGLLAWTLLMLGLLGGVLLHGNALQAHASKWMHTPRYLLLASLAYPVMKALHEAAHALAVRRWGGHVHEAGVTFMMLMPVPYVDASAAHGFAPTWQRALVSAAGIMAELGLAAVGLWCWRWSEGGVLHELGFVVWFVGCVSTVLFNANPLQRLDGYHMLTDALHLPNLAQRSRQWWQTHVMAWLRGKAVESAVTSAPTAPGEWPWLLTYAPLSWGYQVALWSGLTWWLGGIVSALGWVLGALTVWMAVVQPGRRWFGLIWQALLWSGAEQGGVRRRAAALLTLPLLLCMPWPDNMVVQGVVWAPDEALVRPGTEGIVEAVHVKDGAHVDTGELLISLRNPKLDAQRGRIAAQLAQAEQGAFSNMPRDLGKAGQAGDQVQRWQGELQHVDEQIAALQVRAHRAGRLVLPHGDDLPGRYLRRGDLLGQVLSGTPPTVRVAVPDSDVNAARTDAHAVSVLMRMPTAQVLDAMLLRDSIGATRELPSAALSQDMGGQVATDPQDTHHTRTLRPVVTMDVRVDPHGAATRDGLFGERVDGRLGEPLGERLGERVWVRFDHGWSPLPWQAWRWVSHRAAADFNPRR